MVHEAHWEEQGQGKEKGSLHVNGCLRGADNGTRTRGLDLGKVALYQLSYVRSAKFATNINLS